MTGDISRRTLMGGVLAGATVAVLPGTASAVPPPGGTTVVPSDDTAPGWKPVRGVTILFEGDTEERISELVEGMRRTYYGRSWVSPEDGGPDSYVVIQTPHVEVTYSSEIVLTGRYKVVEK